MKNTMFQGEKISRWLVPQGGLNIGTIFYGRPVGNSPEFMPLDNSLNQEVLMSHRFHCAVTYHLRDIDERKFSLRRPKLVTRKYGGIQ